MVAGCNRLAVTFAALLLASLSLPGRTASAADATGNWQNPDNGAILSFFDCGGDLCGKIVKGSKPDLKDDKNPDEARRSQPLDGLAILDHAKKSDETSWKGSLYNAEDGKTYTGYVTLQAPDKLQLKGCALLVFCKSIVFSKASSQ